MTSAQLIEVRGLDDLAAGLAGAGLTGTRPVLVVVGGASGLDDAVPAVVRAVVEQVAVPAAAQCRAAIVDGGTDAGVMRLVGRAHARAGSPTPLVGVAVRSLVRVPGLADPALAPDAAPAEPHHTYLVLVPGAAWGDESPYLSAVAGLLASASPAVTLVVNGGAITLADAQHSVAAGRPVVAAQGTGGAADELVAVSPAGSRRAAAGAPQYSPGAAGLLTVLRNASPVSHQRDQLTQMLRRSPMH